MNERGRMFFYYVYKISLHLFAAVGFILVVGFFAVRFHLTDVSGSVDVNSERFSQVVLGQGVRAQSTIPSVESEKQVVDANSLDNLDARIKQLSEKRMLKAKNYCLIDVIGQYSPGTAAKIIGIYEQTDVDILVAKMILAARLRIEEKNGKSVFANCDTTDIQADDSLINKKYQGSESVTLFPWMNNEQWSTIREAIVKDKNVIEKAAAIAGIEPRLLVSCAIVEQVRLFNSEREIFKKFFEPLKILGNANKISLGVMGIKENTALETEHHLKDLNSPYYLGVDMQNVLDFDDGGSENSRYDRLTENTHYYSYLYGAIYLKQMIHQWEQASFYIRFRPEIVGTLFNVGFPQSKPNASPKVGGSSIEVDGTKYSFGSLVYEFYYSGELTDVFPYVVH